MNIVQFFWSKFYSLKYRLIYSYHHRIKKSTCLLEQELIRQKKDRWLDLGSSINHSNQNFHFADLYPEEECPFEMKSKYFQLNISKPMTTEAKSRLGTFDLIRMQHVFEHFTYEEADVVLDNCYELLNEDGKLLISVPDLDIYIKRYKNRTLQLIPAFGPWASNRLDESATDSDYFSIYAHSLPHQKHLWCYNRNGLINKLELSGNFTNIKRLSLLSKLAGIPFTHNRPQEDLCIVAVKNRKK